MKPIVLIPKKDLTRSVKRRLEREGFVPVGITDCKQPRILAKPELDLSPDILSMAALESIMGGEELVARSKFTQHLYRLLKAKETSK